MQDGEIRQKFSYKKLCIVYLLRNALKIRNYELNQGISSSLILETIKQLLLLFPANDLLSSYFLEIFEIILKNHCDLFINNFLNPQNFTIFLEHYCKNARNEDNENQNNTNLANPEVIRKILKNIKETTHSQVKVNFENYQKFVNFRKFFEQEFKVEDQNYPQVEEEVASDESPVSIVINKDPSNFLSQTVDLS